MDNIFSDMAQMMDALTEPFGDYAPRRRHLLADYKDKEGQDYHQELMTWHNATDKALVESVKAKVARMGFTLSALLEYQDGGKVAALYIAPATWRKRQRSWAALSRRTFPPRWRPPDFTL